MLLEKLAYERLDAPFAEKKVDINTGDIVEILSDASKQPSRFNPKEDQIYIKIQTKNGPRYLNLNQVSINILIDEFKSNDAKDWIGKQAKILLNPTIIGGKKVIVAFLVGSEYELDEWGAPIKATETSPVDDSEIPTINIPEDEKDIKLEDVSF